MSQALSISQSRFYRLRNSFLRAVNASPAVVMVSPIQESSTIPYSVITGTEERNLLPYRRVNAFYTREFDEKKRTKYGLSAETSCVVYFPPDNLVQAFGVPYDQIRIEHVAVFGIVYAVTKVVYLGAFYNNCMVVEVQLRDEETV
jgi:hypothetical protein